ncbi:PAS domain S-box-containing protein/diguanylate cyclase (GGDEF) domain-containing protein [Blastococcus sp. DSM 46786]|uniref:putative bifunctional diguanylate cyclase/phosphodiesterase n=1 Tax=Blastococcus sp. DSM 46786 TaxID=1798227 RepID=UPI0008AD05C3|nr:EAL domain-containing protein [Blastococcus sp. DSM 46786]SEK18789.1 PAS domain S-box-containing protein/diguanylate cyclase (GGDEF) domain-containing protein [Blastococcus sp. DSM 46786]
MVGLGIAVGLVFPPFATGLGVPAQYAERPVFKAACLGAGFLVGALSYALCRCLVGGRLAVLSSHLRSVAQGISQASRTGDWTQSTSQRIRVDSDDQLGETAQAFNSLLDALEAGEHFRALVRNASDVITVVDPSGTVTYQTPSVGWVLGYPPGTLIGTDIHDLVHPEDARTFRDQLASVVRGAPPTSSPAVRMRHRNGSWRWTETVVNDLRDDPAVTGIVLTTRDVSDRRELEEQLRTQAFYDPLTGLPNRALFMERLRAAEELEHDTGTPAAVLFLDLDNLKAVNDTLGHDGGDALLEVVAQRIGACLRPGDTLARLAGDEFAVLLGGPQSGEMAPRVAERILAALREPVLVVDRMVRAGLSIGLATTTTAGVSGIGLLRAADIAMYVAKTSGKGRCEVFQPSHHADHLDRERLQADLYQALERQELVLHYQPIVDLTPRRVTGYEALVRWEHPTRGMVPPVQFITLAEDSGLIVPIGRWILREATRQAAAWQQSDGRGPRMSVNVSVRQFQHPDLVDDVTEALRASGLAPDRLTLEITESLFAEDTAGTTQKLEALKALGIRLALDDFGTGYSSLSYLRRFPIDVLKIDKSFVHGIATCSEDRAVIGAIVALGQILDLVLVAEGIETADELAALEQLGVQYGQGYHLGRPAPPQHASPGAERRRSGSPGAALRSAPAPRAATAAPPGGVDPVRGATTRGHA